MHAARRKNREGKQWILDSKRSLLDIGLPGDSETWTASPTVRLKGVNETQRVRNLLNVCHAVALHKGLPLDELLVDTSCSLPRAVAMMGSLRLLPPPHQPRPPRERGAS